MITGMIEAFRQYWAAITIGVVGAHTSAVMPVIVASLVEKLSFTDSQAGIIAAVELGGLAVAIVFMTPLATKLSPKHAALSGLILLLITNILSILGPFFFMLASLRFLAGFGAGMSFSIMSKLLGTSTSPERVFGLFYFFHMLVVSAAIKSWGFFEQLQDIQGPFLWLSFISVVGLFASLKLSEKADIPIEKNDNELPLQAGFYMLCIIGLIAVFIFNVGVNGVWSFVARIGLHEEIPLPTVHTTLALSVLAGLGGALMSSGLNTKLGRFFPLLFGISCLIIAISLLSGLNKDADLYFMAVFLFMFAWVFSNPYITGVMAQIDSKGRLVVLSMAALFGGLSTGPAVSSAILALGEKSFDTILITMSGILACSLVLLSFSYFRTRKHSLLSK